jgi:DNA-binding LacI/PurR family transcriptional regulator
MIMKRKTRKKTRYRELQETVIKSINSGCYPVGSKLPAGREMAKILDASYVTVNTAMRGLEERGYVRRVHGSGIFVTDPKKNHIQMNGVSLKQVGALVPMRGDLYQNFAESLVYKLEEYNYYLTPLATSAALDTLSEAEQEKRIARFTECHFDSFIVAATRHVPYRLMHKYRESFKQIIFVMHNESGIDLPGLNTVICDYVQVGYLAAKRLLEAGRKKLAFITYEPFTEMETRQNGNRRLGSDYEMIDGAEKAFEEAGISFVDNFDIIHDGVIRTPKVNTKVKVAEYLKRGFDGFICMGDTRAQHVYCASAELSMTPGDDLGVVGLYNTSWTHMLAPKLSSISVDEQKIAEITAEMIMNQAVNEKVVVKPELIERASC